MALLRTTITPPSNLLMPVRRILTRAHGAHRAGRAGALPWLALFLALVLGSKILVVWALARLGCIVRRPLQLAAGLGQVGEFSYVLGALAAGSGLVFAVVTTIAVSSVLVRLVRPSNKQAHVTRSSVDNGSTQREN